MRNRVLRTAAIAVVTIGLALVVEKIMGAIPGTALWNWRRAWFLAGLRPADGFVRWIQSDDAVHLRHACNTTRYFVVWPFTGFVIGLVAGANHFPRRDTVIGMSCGVLGFASVSAAVSHVLFAKMMSIFDVPTRFEAALLPLTLLGVVITLLTGIVGHRMTDRLPTEERIAKS